MAGLLLAKPFWREEKERKGFFIAEKLIQPINNSAID